jgi:hypothetical protein
VVVWRTFPVMMMQPGGGSGGSGGSGGGDTGGGGDTASSALTQSECENGLDRFVAASCSDASGFTQWKTATCPKVAAPASAACAAALERAKASYAQLTTATFFCSGAGTTDSADPSAIDFLLAVMCVSAMNNNSCAGLTCRYNQDCPTGYTCNDAIKKCVKTDAPCVGLPCKYNQDCPTGLTCNDGIKQCTKT